MNKFLLPNGFPDLKSLFFRSATIWFICLLSINNGLGQSTIMCSDLTIVDCQTMPPELSDAEVLDNVTISGFGHVLKDGGFGGTIHVTVT